MDDQIETGIRNEIEKRIDEQCRRAADELSERAALKPLVEQHLQDSRGVFIRENSGKWAARRLGILHSNGGAILGNFSHKSYIKVIDWALDQPMQVWTECGIPMREDEEFRKDEAEYWLTLEYEAGIGYWVATIKGTNAMSQGRTVGEAVLMAFDAMYELNEVDRETEAEAKVKGDG